jgi:hypothetical protein
MPLGVIFTLPITMLFLELEIFKNKLLASNLKMSQIVDLNNLSDHEKVIAVIKSKAKLEALEKVDYQRIYTIDLNKKNDLSGYFTNVEARLGHNPIFKPNLASWVSLLGAWHLMLVKKNNINKPLYRETPIHILDAEPTCSEIAKKKWKSMVLLFRKEPYLTNIIVFLIFISLLELQ